MRRTRSVLMSSVLALAIVGGLAGCGSSADDGAGTTTTGDRPSTTRDGTTSAPPTTGTTQVPPDSPADALQMRPVLATTPCEDATSTTQSTSGDGAQDLRSGITFAPTQDTTTTVPTTTEPVTGTTLGSPGTTEILPSSDGATCYEVGPEGGTGADLATAKADQAEGSWFVTVTAKPTSQTNLNAMFNACYQAEPTCPDQGTGKGAVAIVVDDVVVSAPIVNGENLADESFQISGTFTETEADTLARRLVQ